MSISLSPARFCSRSLWPGLWVLVLTLAGCHQPPAWGAGVIAPLSPTQVQVTAPSWPYHGYQIQALATFEITARVLSVHHYHDDRESQLAPVDLALGWGNMSDSRVLSRLSITQGDRWYFYRWEGYPPLPPAEIISSSANMHIIPGDDTTRLVLASLRPGELITITGYLVSVHAPDGWHWVSSLSRTDVGAHACELVWATNLVVHPYPG